MTKSTTYYTLIGSLPALPPHFDQAERVPISRRRLDQRLKMLDPHDADVIEQMGRFLVWDRQPLERTDQDVLDHYDQFMSSVDNRFARELMHDVITIRTIWVGLRCRRLGLDPLRGIPPVAGQIARNWNHPDFGLGTRYPWISQVDALLTSGWPADLYRKHIEIAWQHAKKLADQYQFTFEAVILYLIRWELVYRWTRRSAEAGQQKFEQLVSQAMGDFNNMFAT